MSDPPDEFWLHDNIMNTMLGFTIYQQNIGASLQWLPAVGTPELEEMVHAYLPGPRTINEKLAQLTLEFCQYALQTGRNCNSKFYPVPAAFPLASAASPASSVAFYDSPSSGSFNASPVVSHMSPWTPAAETFPTLPVECKPKARASTAPRKSTASSSGTRTDFSNHPGMRIMTRDGRDITNCASRGSKTKEQRDHAHLMRIIKACDSCKRKKVRCDPSHKKRTASQASVSSQQSAKPAKRAQKATPPPPVTEWTTPEFDFSSLPDTPSTTSSSSLQSSPQVFDDLWDQFVQFDQEPDVTAPNHLTSDFDFYNPSQEVTTPISSVSSGSPAQYPLPPYIPIQSLLPYTPAPPGPLPSAERTPPGLSAEFSDSSPPGFSSVQVCDSSPPQATVPYLNPPGVPHDSNYVDFTLYSSPTDFFLDEEPQPARKEMSCSAPAAQSPRPRLNISDSRSNVHQAQSTQPSAGPDGGYDMLQSASPVDIVAAHRSEYCVSPSASPRPPRQIAGAHHTSTSASPTSSSQDCEQWLGVHHVWARLRRERSESGAASTCAESSKQAVRLDKGRHDEECTNPGLLGIVGDVKTKIQGIAQIIDGLRCVITGRLSAFLPLARCLTSVKF